MTPVWTEQERHRHVAAVYLSEAASRRDSQPGFAAILETWASRAVARAEAASAGSQPDLFS